MQRTQQEVKLNYNALKRQACKCGTNPPHKILRLLPAKGQPGVGP